MNYLEHVGKVVDEGRVRRRRQAPLHVEKVLKERGNSVRNSKLEDILFSER